MVTGQRLRRPEQQEHQGLLEGLLSHKFHPPHTNSLTHPVYTKHTNVPHVAYTNTYTTNPETQHGNYDSQPHIGEAAYNLTYHSYLPTGVPQSASGADLSDTHERDAKGHGAATSRHFGTPSGASLLRVLLNAIGLPASSPWPQLANNPFLREMETMRSVPALPIPSRKSAAFLLQIYYEVVSPIYPVFTKAELDRMLHAIYLNGCVARRVIDECTVNCFSLIHGLALTILSRMDPTLMAMTEDCVRFTRSGLAEVFMRPSLLGIKCLLSILILNHSRELEDPIWYTSGMAMAMCVDLGLHSALNLQPLKLHESHPTHPEGQQEGSREDEREEERRRVFWTTYSIDRGLSLMYGRPVTLAESVITCPYPSKVPPQVLARFKIRRLQSRILNYQLSLEMGRYHGVPYPSVEEDEFLTELDRWRVNKLGEELTQAGNTELLILRRGVERRNPPAMTRSISIIRHNMTLYATEVQQIAMVEGLLCIHALFLNVVTLLYIYRLNEGACPLAREDVLQIVGEARSMLIQLGMRWSSARESLRVIDEIMASL